MLSIIHFFSTITVTVSLNQHWFSGISSPSHRLSGCQSENRRTRCQLPDGAEEGDPSSRLYTSLGPRQCMTITMPPLSRICAKHGDSERKQPETCWAERCLPLSIVEAEPAGPHGVACQHYISPPLSRSAMLTSPPTRHQQGGEKPCVSVF